MPRNDLVLEGWMGRKETGEKIAGSMLRKMQQNNKALSMGKQIQHIDLCLELSLTFFRIF